MKHKGSGKIIAIVGGPRSGKSFLADLLAKHYKGVKMLEGEELDIPKRIIENIEKNIRPLERIIWFRNQAIKRYQKALRLKEEGKIVVLDTFWISYQMYIDTLLKGFEKKLLKEFADIEKKILQWPDHVILLKLSESGMRELIKRGGRSFDQSEDFIVNQALPVNKMHDIFFAQSKHAKNLIVIERDNIDFTRPEHLELVTSKIINKEN